MGRQIALVLAVALAVAGALAAHGVVGAALRPTATRRVRVPENFAGPLDAVFDLLGLPRDAPLVFTHSRVSTWPAMAKWDLNTLRAKLRGSSLPVKRQADAVFAVGCCEVHATLADELFDAIERGPSESGFWYTSVALPRALAGDVREAGVLFADSPARNVTRYFWAGSEGATAELHNDYMDNFFVQVFGTKRFVLASPSAWRELYTFPRFDFRHRHAHVPVRTPELVTARLPRAAALEMQHADLSEGDVLFLPAFWWHEVVALEPSVSVNFWTPVPQLAALESAWQAPMPHALATAASAARDAPATPVTELDDARARALALLRGYCARLLDSALNVNAAADTADASAASDMFTPGRARARARARAVLLADMAERYRPLYELLAEAAPVARGADAQRERRRWLLAVPSRSNADVAHYRSYAEAVLAVDPLLPGLDEPELAALCARMPAVAPVDVELEPSLAALGLTNEILTMQFYEDVVAQLVGEDLLLAFTRQCMLAASDSLAPSLPREL